MRSPFDVHAKLGPQKKRYKDLYLPNEWPNPAVVRLILFHEFRADRVSRGMHIIIRL